MDDMDVMMIAMRGMSDRNDSHFTREQHEAIGIIAQSLQLHDDEVDIVWRKDRERRMKRLHEIEDASRALVLLQEVNENGHHPDPEKCLHEEREVAMRRLEEALK